MATEHALHVGGYTFGADGKHFIAAATGEPINLLDPDPGTIHLSDVARGLAMTCRFAGQVDRFSSVAEHCVLVHDLIENEYHEAGPLPTYVRVRMQRGILHDAPEAYIHDVTAPLKRVLQMLGSNAYAEVQARWTEAVQIRFGLPAETAAEHRIIKRFDYDAACFEGSRIKIHEPFYQSFAGKPLPRGVECAFGLLPAEAEELFLARCKRLSIS